MTALGASAAETDRLVLLVQGARNEMTDWRQSPDVVGGIQNETAGLEAGTAVIRIFQPNVIVGLAQTAEYARGILSSIEEVYEAPGGDPNAESVARALTARIRRQEVLARPNREFHFLMGEAALSGRFITANQMLAQIDRLRQLAEQDNVVLRFIRSDAGLRLTLPLLHGFELIDDAAVFIDSFNTSMISRGAKDLAKYRVVFDRLERSADPDPTAMLDRYEGIYKEVSE
jgi:hypothetical protein